MGKTGLIIQREYLTRVKKKSFIVMTVLVPVLVGGFILGAIYLSLKEKVSHKVLVVDETHLFEGKFKRTEDLEFSYYQKTVLDARKEFYDMPFSLILYIPRHGDKQVTQNVNIFFKKEPGIVAIEKIREEIERIIYETQLEQNGIDLQKVEAAHLKAAITTSYCDEKGSLVEKNTNVLMSIGIISGIFIYMFIFLYGVQVMRGVIEEKTSRVIEVIVSSVKPFQLMLGKIIGVALVGLTQFLIWVVLTFAVFTVGKETFLKQNIQGLIPSAASHEIYKPGQNITAVPNQGDEEANQMITQAMGVFTNKTFIITILLVFIFYFIGGYLLYSALFAAFGAAVDSETETQQFMLPVSMPLILAYILSFSVMQNPEGPLSFWLSIIPFTSPVIMMVRLPFGVPMWQVGLSMLLLIAGFIFTTWLAGRIYRTGILMYGKKVSYRELWKWLTYRG